MKTTIGGISDMQSINARSEQRSGVGFISRSLLSLIEGGGWGFGYQAIRVFNPSRR